MNTKDIYTKDLVFTKKTRLACLSCKNYNKKATCPPHIPEFNWFKNILSDYKYGRVYYDLFPVKQDIWEKDREASSLIIHEYLLKERKKLLDDGRYLFFALGAGSCKLCKQCSFPCNKPQESLIPIEATGIDIVSTLKIYNIDINFPIKDYYYRIGLLLWD